MSLKDYERKRNFKKTPEPPAELVSTQGDLRFVVQLHEASRRHFDFRLELDGTMKSWAVPRGPSIDPNDQRLAVMVEDHPMSYRLFEGIIPKGNYGAGTVLVWDEGTYVARGNSERKAGENELRAGLGKGHITFILSGKKLRGEFALVKIKRGEPNAWLLVKKRDGFHSYEKNAVNDLSVLTDRGIQEIAKEAEGKGEVWLPGKGLIEKPKAKSKKSIKNIESKKSVKPVAKKTGGALRAHKNPEQYLKTAAESELDKNPKQRRFKIKLRHNMPVDKGFIFEPEWDGYRAFLTTEHGASTLSSRLSKTLHKKFPDIAAKGAKFSARAIFDGHVVLVDKQGIPRSKSSASSPPTSRTALYHATDLLHYEGRDLCNLSLDKRKALLTHVLAKHTSQNDIIQENPYFSNESDAQSYSTSNAIKGLLIRAASGDYESGDGWISHFKRESTAAASNDHATVKERSNLDRDYDSKSDVRSEVTATPPAIAARDKNAPKQVVLTNLKKVYWPKEAFTKGDLIDYYRAVAPYMIPHLLDRPQSLNRHPNGIEGKSFFQKEMTGQVPRWMSTTLISSHRKSITYALCQDVHSLLYLANLGCIEINVWNSRWQHIDCPDYVVVDMDPGKIAFSEVVEVALTARGFLDKMQAASFCKTSGGRGMHIYIPIKPKYTHDEVREFSYELSLLIHKTIPAITSLERSPAKRANLIYLDFLQNRRGQTMAAPYSARPRPNALVSMPLRWSEVTKRLDPGDYSIKTALRRLDRLGDAWEHMHTKPNDLGTLRKKLREIASKSGISLK